MKTKAIQFGLTLLSLLFVYHISYADGVYIPTAKKKIPDIPVQRALVKYRAGTEALIVESTLNGEGGDYGWIIPVPNPPKKFEKVPPGVPKNLILADTAEDSSCGVSCESIWNSRINYFHDFDRLRMLL